MFSAGHTYVSNRGTIIESPTPLSLAGFTEIVPEGAAALQGVQDEMGQMRDFQEGMANGNVTAAAVQAVGQMVGSCLQYATQKIYKEMAEHTAETKRDIEVNSITKKTETMHIVENISGQRQTRTEELARLESQEKILDGRIASAKRINKAGDINLNRLKAQFSDLRRIYQSGTPHR